MSFALFVVYLLVTFGRPAEHFAELRDLPIVPVASVLALTGAAVAVLLGSRPPLRTVQVALVLALTIWMTFSVLVNHAGYEDPFERVLGFGKSSLTAFLLVILNVTNLRRVRAIAFVLAIPAVFLAYQTISGLQEHTAESSQTDTQDLQGTRTDSEWDEPEAEAKPKYRFSPDQEFRVMQSGLFGDPNDLALTLIAILPFVLALQRSGALVRNVLVVWLPVAVILYGIYATRSRGGVLALACVLGLLVRHRLGNWLSLATASLAVLVLLGAGFVGKRSMSMDASASGRVEMWSAGLQNLKQSPVWGIGFSNFDRFNGRASHSAFVQCFAELGLVGYLVWLGLLLVTLDDLRLIHASTAEDAVDLRKWARVVQVSLIGFLVGSIFLSRAWDVQLFVLIGLGAAIGELARRRGYLVRSRSLLAWGYILGGTAVVTIVGYWVYMRYYF